MIRFWRFLNASLDRFLFDSCEPIMCSVLRVLMGIMLCIYAFVWWLDGSWWFSDEGVLRAETSRQLYFGEFKSWFVWLPQTPAMVQACLLLLGAQSALLLLGVWSRFQAAGIFLLLTAMQHRNVLIVDGQDTVLRWFVFLMIFMPLDYAWSLGRLLVRRKPTDPYQVAIGRRPLLPGNRAKAWALRLLQIELTAIYFSTAFIKVAGPTWRDGTALFYVARMDDVFGRLWLPDYLFETPWIVKCVTWSVLAVEIFLPFGLWIPRLRLTALFLALALHLAIEYSMNLFLFEWLMIAGLTSFLRPAELGLQRWSYLPLASRVEPH